jgi:hypothetical protein
MTTEQWLLAASLVANAVLVTLFFLKTALNEILTQRYKRGRERKEAERRILLELNARMSTYHRDYFMLLVNLGLKHSATTPDDQALADASMKEAGEALQATNGFCDQHELEVPDSIREMMSQLRRAIVIPTAALGRVLSREELLARSEAVQAVTDRMRTEVKRLVR